MKKRITSLILVVAMVAMTLVGCGSDTTDTTNTTNEPNIETNTEVDEPVEDVVTDVPTEEPIETPSVDEPTEDVVVEDGEDYPFSYESTWVFPEGMTGETTKFVFANDETWSLNYTHYEDNNGNEMNFVWESPVTLGEQAVSDGRNLVLLEQNRNYQFRAVTFGYSENDAQCIDLPKETWISYADDVVPYVENSFYNVEITDTTIEVTFKVLGNGYEGYNYYIIDTTNEICYQFAYLENIEIYDDTRAMNVINSISYWEEYSTESTNN